MAQMYAGVLGPLALITALAHGWATNLAINDCLIRGWLALVAFTLLGFAIGHVAQNVVDEDFRKRVESELENNKSSESDSTTTTA